MPFSNGLIPDRRDVAAVPLKLLLLLIAAVAFPGGKHSSVADALAHSNNPVAFVAVVAAAQLEFG